MNAAPRAARGAPPGWLRVLLGGALLLALGATGLVVFSDEIRWLRLAAVLALWAALIAAFAVSRSRRDTRTAELRQDESKRTYELELLREVTARREYETKVAEAAREDADLAHREELAALREQLERLTNTLAGFMDGDLLVERLTLSAESTRVRQVGGGDGVRSLLANLTGPPVVNAPALAASPLGPARPQRQPPGGYAGARPMPGPGQQGQRMSTTHFVPGQRPYIPQEEDTISMVKVVAEPAAQPGPVVVEPVGADVAETEVAGAEIVEAETAETEVVDAEVVDAEVVDADLIAQVGAQTETEVEAVAEIVADSAPVEVAATVADQGAAPADQAVQLPAEDEPAVEVAEAVQVVEAAIQPDAGSAPEPEAMEPQADEPQAAEVPAAEVPAAEVPAAEVPAAELSAVADLAEAEAEAAVEPGHETTPDHGSTLDPETTPEPETTSEPETEPAAQPRTDAEAERSVEPATVLPTPAADEDVTAHSAGVSVADLLAAYGTLAPGGRRRRRAEED